MVKVGEIWDLVTPVKVFRIHSDATVDVCDGDGSCLTVVEKDLVTIIKNDNMKAMKDAVLKVAQTLAKANNTVTTLEIKNELRRDYPYYFWTQLIVSTYMDQLAGDGLFSYTDNGTYRIYSLVKAKKANTVVTLKASKKASLTKTVKASSSNVTSTAGTQWVNIQKAKITDTRLLSLASHPQFVAVILANGQNVTKNTIKQQKKSPVGYISPKLGRIKSILVGTTLYNVK